MLQGGEEWLAVVRLYGVERSEGIIWGGSDGAFEVWVLWL